jgi:hypothetical protein
VLHEENPFHPRNLLAAANERLLPEPAEWGQAREEDNERKRAREDESAPAWSETVSSGPEFCFTADALPDLILGLERLLRRYERFQALLLRVRLLLSLVRERSLLIVEKC